MNFNARFNFELDDRFAPGVLAVKVRPPLFRFGFLNESVEFLNGPDLPLESCEVPGRFASLACFLEAFEGGVVVFAFADAGSPLLLELVKLQNVSSYVAPVGRLAVDADLNAGYSGANAAVTGLNVDAGGGYLDWAGRLRNGCGCYGFLEQPDLWSCPHRGRLAAKG